MAHPGWNEAVLTEMKNIHTFCTWTLIPPTKDMNIVSSKWVHTVKLNPDGTVRKHRSRLVAKGFQQEEDLDYLETFSPVVRTSTIRLVLDIAIAKEWQIKQLTCQAPFFFVISKNRYTCINQRVLLIHLILIMFAS